MLSPIAEQKWLEKEDSEIMRSSPGVMILHLQPVQICRLKTANDCSLILCRVNWHKKFLKFFQLFGYRTNNQQHKVYFKNQDKQSCSFPWVAEVKRARLLEGMASILHLTCCSNFFVCLFHFVMFRVFQQLFMENQVNHLP